MTQVIREKNKRGRLTAAGYRWRESVRPVQALAALGILGGVGLVGLAGMKPDHNAMIVGGLVAVIGLILKSLGYRKRALIFYANGEVKIPHSIPGHLRARRIVSGVNGIHSIAMRTDDENQRENQYRNVMEVVMFMHSGEVIALAKDLHQNYAHQIAVQLNRALDDIRNGF